MPSPLSVKLTAISVANAFILCLGIVLFGFAHQNRTPNEPQPLLYWGIAAIPLLAVVCTLLAWFAPWPFTTARRRIIVGAAPLIYVCIGWLASV
jgi:hypothetical protein